VRKHRPLNHAKVLVHLPLGVRNVQVTAQSLAPHRQARTVSRQQHVDLRVLVAVLVVPVGRQVAPLAHLLALLVPVKGGKRRSANAPHQKNKKFNSAARYGVTFR